MDDQAITESLVKGREVFRIKGPDIAKDRLVDLHISAASALKQRFGIRPGRASLHRWRVRGYPVIRKGPLVILPTATMIKRVYTSYPALATWFETIKFLSEDISQAGGLKAWRKRRRASERSKP